MFAESGGHFCDPLFAFLITYNAVKGNYAKEEGTFGYEIEFPYLYVSSPEDYANYQQYFVEMMIHIQTKKSLRWQITALMI